MEKRGQGATMSDKSLGESTKTSDSREAEAAERIRAKALARALAAGHGPSGGRRRLIKALREIEGEETLKTMMKVGLGVDYMASVVGDVKSEQREWVLKDALRDAARAGSVNALWALVGVGADPTWLSLGKSLMVEACSAGRGEAIRELGAWGLSARESDFRGVCVAMLTAMAGAGLSREFGPASAGQMGYQEIVAKTRDPAGFDALDAVLELGADIDDMVGGELTPLAELCAFGDVCEEAVKALLERGAKPNGKRRDRPGPLARAAQSPALSGKLCELLLRFGAIPEGPERAANASARAALEAWELAQDGVAIVGRSSPRL